MTDPKKDHWNSLASDLGAEPSEPEQETASSEEAANPDSDSESSTEAESTTKDRADMVVDGVAVPEPETLGFGDLDSADAAKPSAESKPSISSGWDSLHGELGLDPLPAPSKPPETTSASAPAKSESAKEEKTAAPNPSEPFPTSTPPASRSLPGFGAGLLGDEPEAESIIIDEGEGNVDSEAITRDYVAPVIPEQAPPLELPDFDDESNAAKGLDHVELVDDLDSTTEDSSESKPRSEREDARPRRRRRRGRGRGDSERGNSDRDNAQADSKGSRRQTGDSETESKSEEAESENVRSSETDKPTDDESRPKRRRRRGRRRRKDSSEETSAKTSEGGDDSTSDAAVVNDNAKNGEKDEEDRPRRRRRRRRRGRFADNDSDQDEARSVAASHDDVEVLAELDEEESDVLADQLSLQDGVDDGDDTADDPKHRSIPSWLDAVGVVVDANLESRANRPSGGGGGGRGRRRRS